MHHSPARSPLFRLFEYSKQYRWQIVRATLFSVLNRLFDLAPPLLIGAAVDVVVSQEDSIIAWLGFEDVATQLWLLAALTLGVWAFESIFEYAFSLGWRNLAQTIQHDLRLDAYSHIQNLEVAYFENRTTGGLMAILNDDINQLERFLDNGASQLIQLITTVVFVGGVFIAVIPGVAWMTLLPIPFIIWGSLWFQKRLEPRYADVREEVALLNAELANNLGGIATIKSFTAEEYEVTQIEQQSRCYQMANRRAIVLSSAFVPLIRMVIVVGFIAIMVYGGQLVVTGDLNIGAYSVLVFMTQRLLWPLTNLGTMLDLYQRAMASTARVLNLLDTTPQMKDGDQSLAVETVRGDVSLNDVSFNYNNSGGATLEGLNEMDFHQPHPVIRHLSLRIPAGQTAAIVGATGAGKSTIIKLLLRFYDVEVGRILLDGIDIRNLKLVDLRRAIGFVSQDVFLFHGTVRENIAYGTFDAPMERIIEAAKIAEAHEFIMALPRRYDTVVGERGQKLSGGQRQRISIARAVLKDPPVLILDEATSSVDNETEAAIQRSMERIAVGRTTIVIAHRLSTVRNADMIFVMEKGELKELGTHQELVAAGGIYASLWRVQTGLRPVAV